MRLRGSGVLFRCSLLVPLFLLPAKIDGDGGRRERHRGRLLAHLLVIVSIFCRVVFFFSRKIWSWFSLERRGLGRRYSSPKRATRNATPALDGLASRSPAELSSAQLPVRLFR
ncbi:unnamed protein product [Calypogeia fissa]